MHFRWCISHVTAVPVAILLSRHVVLYHVAGMTLDRCADNGECRHEALNDALEAEGQSHVSLLQDTIGMRFPGDFPRLEGQRGDLGRLQSERARTNEMASQEFPALQRGYQGAEYQQDPIYPVSQMQATQREYQPPSADAAPSVPRANMARAMEHDLESAAEDVQMAWSQLQAANAHAKLAVTNAENFYALNQEITARRPRLAALQMGRGQRVFEEPEPDPTDLGQAPAEYLCGGADQVECSTLNRVLTWDYRLTGTWSYTSWGAVIIAWVLLTAVGCFVIKIATRTICMCQVVMVIALLILLYGICHNWLDNAPDMKLPENFGSVVQGQMNSLKSSAEKLQSQVGQ